MIKPSGLGYRKAGAGRARDGNDIDFDDDPSGRGLRGQSGGGLEDISVGDGSEHVGNW
jgi:hypothetical protein